MPSLPPHYASRRNADCMSPTLRASPRGEVPSLSRRRGDSLTFRYSHFYRLHTSLYLNTSSIRLNSYAYKLLSPLSRPSGASSPQGEPLIMLAAVDNLSHGLYTKSLSSGRGAELVEAERGFANLSLFAFL